MGSHGCLLLTLLAFGASGASAAVSFRQVELVATFENCAGPRCTVFRVSYPVVTEAPSETTRAFITRNIEEWAFYYDGPTESAEAAAARLFDEFRPLYEEYGDAASPFRLDREITVSHLSDGLMSLRVETHAFTGGAHGNASVGFVNLDLNAQQTIEPSELFVKEREVAVRVLLASKIRESHGLPAGASLVEAGYELAEDRLPKLPRVIGITDDGLVFFYNNYEIASYAMGATQVRATWDEVAELLRPDSPVLALATAAQ